MTIYVHIYYDGCNGFKRGKVVNWLPKGYSQTNPGVWEGSNEESFYIEVNPEESRDPCVEDDVEEKAESSLKRNVRYSDWVLGAHPELRHKQSP